MTIPIWDRDFAIIVEFCDGNVIVCTSVAVSSASSSRRCRKRRHCHEQRRVINLIDGTKVVVKFDTCSLRKGLTDLVKAWSEINPVYAGVRTKEFLCVGTIVRTDLVAVSKQE